MDDRRAIQVNAHLCNKERRQCKTDPEIVDFTDHFIMNLFVLQQRAELSRHETTDMLKTQLLFHSQQLLYADKYRDNNNFVRHNKLQFTLNRWSLAPKEYVNQFLDFEAYPTWIGNTLLRFMNTTRDKGQTWKVERYDMIFGAYFFLSEDRVERFKNLSAISDVITTLEGVSGLIFLLIVRGHPFDSNSAEVY